MDSRLQTAIHIIEGEAIQLEAWASQTRTPAGYYTILGEEMIARAQNLRAQIKPLKSQGAESSLAVHMREVHDPDGLVTSEGGLPK